MLTRIWSALTNLVSAIDALTGTVAEINARAREQLALDAPATTPEEGEPTNKRQRKSAA